MPVRSVTNRYGGTHIIGQFPSLKMGCAVPFESTIEMDCLYLLDYEPCVAAFDVQPLTISYSDGPRTRQYTPDILVTFHNHYLPLLLECKPEAQRSKLENQRKFTAAQHWCASQNIRYRIVTDEVLREGHYLRNIKLLAQFARHPYRMEVHHRVIAMLKTERAALPLAVLAASISPDTPSKPVTAFYTLLYHQHLMTDLNQAPLSLECRVWLPEETGGKYDNSQVYPFHPLLLGDSAV